MISVGAISFFSCHSANHPGLKNGIYRAVLTRTDSKQIIFNFEVKEADAKPVLYVLNGDEHLLVNGIKYFGDSISIEMPFFNSGFKALIEKNGNLSGTWIKRDATSNKTMPFTATYGDKERFVVSGSPKVNVNGRWAVNFTNKTGRMYPAVGEFVQTGSKLTGTFLAPSGDFRFLEGNVSNDSICLSGFDGEHAFLFQAIVQGDSLADGHFYSGFAGKETWTARRDATAKLKDGYAATKMKNASDVLDFTFPDLNNKPVSIRDPKYKGKVVLVQIMGSWCPNCMDETRFLSDYYNKNRQRGFELIALAYETSTDFNRAKRLLQPFREKFNVKYPMLITGVTATDTMLTEKTLPQVEKIVSFPTSIFVDKSGKVRKIFTGFSGPGTGVHFEEFKKEFEATIDGLLNEKG